MFDKHTLILASNSVGKKREMLEIFAPLIPKLKILTAQEAGFSPIDPEETGDTFEANARIKAEAFMKHTGMPCIADDSGLCVDALDGAPGIHSARYGGDHDPDSAIPMMLDELKDVPREKRTARFVCHICCMFPDGRELHSDGTCEGYIGYERGGEEGFGFDPIFYLLDDRCFGGIPSEEKNMVSHRGNAARAIADRLREEI